MSIGDKVKLKSTSSNATTYKEYTDCVGVIIDVQAKLGEGKQYFRVAFSERGVHGSYIDVGAWRVEKTS